MVSFFRAFVWLRWRLLVNSFKGGERRDTMERVSRVAALVAPAILLPLAVGAVLTAGALGTYAGWLLGRGAAAAPVTLISLRAVLFAMTVVVGLAQVFAATHGSPVRYQRLLLLPIPHRALHVVELLATLVDPWMAFVVPGLLGVSIGLAAAGAFGAALVAAAALLALGLLLASLASLVAFALSLLGRDRRRSEIFTLLFVVCLTVISLMPSFFLGDLGNRKRAARQAGTSRTSMSLADLEVRVPAWALVLPSELYGVALKRAAADPADLGVAWLSVGAIAAQAAILFTASRTVHRRLLGSVEDGRVTRRGTKTRYFEHRIPGLSVRASSVAIAQFLNAVRSVRGRLVILLPGPLLAGLSVLFRQIPDEGLVTRLLGSQGDVLFGAGVLFSLYALQGVTMNQLGSDRAGLTLQFLSPISEKELVRGKATGCALLLAVSVACCFVSAVATTPGGPPIVWMAVALGAVPTYLVIAPVGAWLSALFPVASDMSKTGPGGNPHGFAMVIGTALVAIAAAPAGLIVGVGYHVLGRPVLTAGLMLAWTAIAGAVSLPLLTLTARTVALRRENLAMVAQGK